MRSLGLPPAARRGPPCYVPPDVHRSVREPLHARHRSRPHFYRDLLGFTETFRTPKQGIPEHVELSLNGFGLGLGTVEAARRVHGVEASPGTRAMVLVVWTTDVDRTFEQLTAGGAPVVQPPHDTGTHNRNALLRDPDGNLVEIVARVR